MHTHSMREDLLISTIFWIKILLTRMYRKRVCTWCCFYHSTSSSSSFQQMQFFLFQYKWMHFIRSLFINLLGFDGLSKSTNNSNSSILPLKQKKHCRYFSSFIWTKNVHTQWNVSRNCGMNVPIWIATELIKSLMESILVTFSSPYTLIFKPGK